MGKDEFLNTYFIRGECLDKTNHKYVKKGDTFQRRGKNGLVEICTCAGQGFGRIDCVGKDGMCYDRGLDRWYREGERWETSHPENGQIMDCVCHDRGNNIGVDCTTGNRCHDQGRSYKANEQWTKMSDKGERIRCTCHGMGKGMWSCVNYPDDQVTYEEDTSIPPPSSRPLNPDSCQGNHF